MIFTGPMKEKNLPSNRKNRLPIRDRGFGRRSAFSIRLSSTRSTSTDSWVIARHETGGLFWLVVNLDRDRGFQNRNCCSLVKNRRLIGAHCVSHLTAEELKSRLLA